MLVKASTQLAPHHAINSAKQCSAMLVKACTQLAQCNQQCMCKFLDLLLPKYEKPWGTMGEAKKAESRITLYQCLGFLQICTNTLKTM